jgi:hypothetical protein
VPDAFRRMPANTRFLVKLVLFFAPIVLYVALTAAIPLYAGEFSPVEEVAARQSAGEAILYGPAYRDNYYVFKRASTIQRRPEVLVLGSSRSMQFRAGLFGLNERFYNAGGAAQSVFEARRFVADLPADSLPRLLIVGLDQPWFNAGTGGQHSPSRIQHQIDAERGAAANRAMNTGRFFFWDLCQGKIPLLQLLRRQDPVSGRTAVGIAAAVRGAGFRNDGSYQYGTLLNPDPVDRRMAEGYQRLRDGAGHFVPGDAVSQPGLDEVEALLTFARARGIDVVGFAPPYAPGMYRRMEEDGRHTYRAKSASMLTAAFERRGFRFFDFSDAAAVGAGDDDMIDGFHASEFVCLKMYLAMLETLPETLGRYSDLGLLKQRASAPRAHRLLAFDSDGR